MVLFQDAHRLADSPLDRASADLREQPLLAPVTPDMSFDAIHAMSQTPMRGPDEQLTTIRRTATIRRGTRMIKLLSRRQLGPYLHGRRPSGFCYREYDLDRLRENGDLALLLNDSSPSDSHGDKVVFGLRWRAVDASDYHIPFSVTPDPESGEMDHPHYAGMTTIAPHDRLGPAVLGTGFAPSQNHLVPEFVTADLADLPMPAGTSLVAFTPDGTEVSLFLYIPEQRAWTRMFGPHYRHLVAGLPDVSVEQEYVQTTVDYEGGSVLLGNYQGTTYEAMADPPHEFRVLAKARAARYPVESVFRRTRYVSWRGVGTTVVRVEGDWVRLRLCRPDRGTAATVGGQCVERGVYEAWAPIAEVGAVRDMDLAYAISGPLALGQTPHSE